MIIKSLKLKNIRSYRSLNLEFLPGSTLLSGDIGSGKSSILLAIEFALFGLKRGELAGGALLRHGQKDGFSELRFEIDKKDVIVKRTLKSARGKIVQDAGYIIIDGVKEELTASELKIRVYEVLGYPVELISKSKDMIFRYTVYTPQEMMKGILLDDPEIRLDILRRVFNIDKYKRVKENTAVVSRFLREKLIVAKAKIESLDSLKQKKGEISELIDNHKIAYETACKDAEEICKNVEKLKGSVLVRRKYKEELLGRKADLQGTDSDIINAVQRRSDNNKRIEKHRQDIAAIDEKLSMIKVTKIDIRREDLEKEIEDLNKKIVDANSIRSKLSQERAYLESRIRESDEQISSRKSSLAENDKKLAELRSKISKEKIDPDEVSKDIVSLKKEKENLINEIGEYSARSKLSLETISKIGSIDTCPLCRQDVTHEHKQKITYSETQKSDEAKQEIKLRNEKVEKIGEKLAALEEKLKTLNDEKLLLQEKTNIENHSRQIKEEMTLAEKTKEETVKKLDANITETEKLPDISGLDLKLTAKKETLKQVQLNDLRETEIRSMEANRKEKREEIDALEKDAADMKLKVGELNSKKAALRKKIDELSAKAEGLEDEEKMLEQLQKKEQEAMIVKASKNGEIDSLIRQLSGIRDEIKKLDEHALELKRNKKYKAWLDEQFYNLVNSIEQHVMMSIYTEFNEYLINWFAMLLDEETINVRLDDRFTPEIVQNGYDTEFLNMSGGEKTALSLAYRLALNKVINNFIGHIKTKDLIILDEPTDGFSTQQLDSMRDVLDELGLKQIIIVSHEKKVEGYVDHVINISKDNHMSNVY